MERENAGVPRTAPRAPSFLLPPIASSEDEDSSVNSGVNIRTETGATIHAREIDRQLRQHRAVLSSIDLTASARSWRVAIVFTARLATPVIFFAFAATLLAVLKLDADDSMVEHAPPEGATGYAYARALRINDWLTWRGVFAPLWGMTIGILLLTLARFSSAGANTDQSTQSLAEITFEPADASYLRRASGSSLSAQIEDAATPLRPNLPLSGENRNVSRAGETVASSVTSMRAARAIMAWNIRLGLLLLAAPCVVFCVLLLWKIEHPGRIDAVVVASPLVVSAVVLAGIGILAIGRGVRWVRIANDYLSAAAAGNTAAGSKALFKGFKHHRRVGMVLVWAGVSAILFVAMSLPAIFTAASKIDSTEDDWSWTATLTPVWVTSAGLTLLACCGCCSNMVETHSDAFGAPFASKTVSRGPFKRLRRTLSPFWVVPLLAIFTSWSTTILLITLRLDLVIEWPYLLCLSPLLFLEVLLEAVVASVAVQKIHARRVDGTG